MNTLKADAYAALSTIDGVDVSQGDQNVFNELPAVTFNLSNNFNNHALDGALLSQNAELKVDIWGNTSTEASGVLESVVAALLPLGYILSYTQDVPNPADSIIHVTTRFRSAVV